MSSTKKITIKDLCPEEKKKIGELLKRLSTETEEKKHLQQLLEQDKQFYESQIKTLKESSILHQKTSTDPLEFKSESFAQSFVAAPDKQGATSQDIKFLRNKFDSVYSKLKKAVAINETLINKNSASDSIDEEIPNTYKPVPIKQDTNANCGYKNGNLLTTSLMAEDDSMNFGNGNEEKSFISTNANEDLLNGFGMISVNNNNNVGVYNKRNVNSYQFGNSLNSNSGNRSNSPAKVNKFNFGSGNTGSKYKEILGRIREKSQEQNNMKNNNNNYSNNNNKLGISQLTNSYNGNNNNNINSFRVSKNNNNNNNAFISPSPQFQMTSTNNNNMNISISKEFQMQFNPIHSQINNNNNNQSNNIYQPQTIDNINLNLSINNNNNNNNTISNHNTNNNEYMNVINFLNNNKHSVNNFSKLNTSQNDNNTLNNILSTSSSITNTSKLEDACNDNVFNYIFKLEGCVSSSNHSNNTNNTKPAKTKEVSSQMDEIEKELNDLQQSNFPLDHTDYDYQPEHHNKRNPIFNDFKSISSKYI